MSGRKHKCRRCYDESLPTASRILDRVTVASGVASAGLVVGAMMAENPYIKTDRLWYALGALSFALCTEIGSVIFGDFAKRK